MQKYDILTNPRPHPDRPADLCPKAQVKFLGARDHLAAAPEAADATEAGIMIELLRESLRYHEKKKTNLDIAWGYSKFTSRGRSTNVKLALRRIGTWRWAHWNTHAPDRIYWLTEAGIDAVRRYLVDAAPGFAHALELRQRFFPTPEEIDAKRRRTEEDEARRTHEFEVASRRSRANETALCIEQVARGNIVEIERRMLDLAHAIGAAANNLDDIIAELRTLESKIDEQKAIARTAGRAIDRIRAAADGEILALEPDAKNPYDLDISRYLT